jgi:hypothetical protein
VRGPFFQINDDRGIRQRGQLTPGGRSRAASVSAFRRSSEFSVGRCVLPMIRGRPPLALLHGHAADRHGTADLLGPG